MVEGEFRQVNRQGVGGGRGIHGRTMGGGQLSEQFTRSEFALGVREGGEFARGIS